MSVFNFGRAGAAGHGTMQVLQAGPEELCETDLNAFSNCKFQIGLEELRFFNQLQFFSSWEYLALPSEPSYCHPLCYQSLQLRKMPGRVWLQSVGFSGSFLGEVSAMVLCPWWLLRVSLGAAGVGHVAGHYGHVFPFSFLLSLEKVLLSLWDFNLCRYRGIRTMAYPITLNEPWEFISTTQKAKNVGSFTKEN